MDVDNVYSEVIPKSFVKNAPAIFKKNVKKAMKYYNRYKDADTVTYMRKIPDPYRDFIKVARKIHDSDELVIHDPFCLYDPGVGEVSSYYIFHVNKNGKRFCMFYIYIDDVSNKFSFDYTGINLKYDDKTTKSALFYTLGGDFYAATPDKTICISKHEEPGGERMKMQSDGVDWEAILKKSYREFQKKTYEEKKNEIFNRAKKSQNKKAIKQAEKNMRLELKDDSVGAESDVKALNSGKTYYVVIGIICVIAVVAGILLVRKRKR
ncbi:hypothetical protein [Roseburia sp. AM59-24XD]|uniref:hypothetical protein n=1 Tax=Roseburia sp. AM59-24XD TaxID=2293138 RepID=UPI0011C39E6E|nr:hypothetical protein [Roseburia sp. AM59-24XD]